MICNLIHLKILRCWFYKWQQWSVCLLCDQGKVCVHITNRWKLNVIVGCSFRSAVVPLWEHGQWAVSGTELRRHQNSSQGHRLSHRGKANLGFWLNVFTNLVVRKLPVCAAGGKRVGSDHLHRERALHVEVRLWLRLLCGPETSRRVLS